MGLLADVLLFPVVGPRRGLQFILEQIREQVDAEMFDQGQVERKLIDLHLRYDLGEITEDDFSRRETEMLQELNAVRAYNVVYSDADGPAPSTRANTDNRSGPDGQDTTAREAGST